MNRMQIVNMISEHVGVRCRRLVFVGLLGLTISACSRPAQMPPSSAPQPGPQERYPEFFRNAKRHVIFDGSSANLSLISRTLGEGMYRHIGPGFVWAVFGARGHAYYEGMVALGEGEVDFAMTTPAVTAKMAMEGKGYFKKAYPNLRAIAVYPQNDWIGCAVSAKLGINSFDDIRTKKAPLKIATGPIGKNDMVGFTVEQLLGAYGISVKDVESWGGKFLEARVSGQAIEKMLSGDADMACHEAWKSFYKLAEKVPVKFLPASDEVLNQLQQKFGYQRNVIRKGLFRPNVPDRDIPVVDYSDWPMITRAELPDDLAYLITQTAIEDRKEIEEFYTSVPEKQRGMDLPLKPEIMWKNVGVPLHPGAEKYYREKSLLK